ncbi:TIGR02444 family protein [Pseudoalteromonas sp. OOF1S-7]|uniref:TIGR02444 family protein n=1 Tax=Pseudoalteromonas sp. OOF1S-7 TaxID=2917757 RepID=UPI001EF56034|nr:TIGR02444 family protein [Pseudoalteromonas sp. OOF1S-7]MCG7537618.1 TIGR02444 family protein [Pseudoalteromonas sp. OOF1S-7]
MLDAADFWTYACTHYARAGMQDALLSLQENEDKNVNLILLLMYLDACGRSLTAEQFAGLHAVCEAFDHTVLHPQRRVRATLKNQHQHYAQYAELREFMLKAELAQEKLQQSLLINYLNQHPLQPNSSADNLTHYLTPTQQGCIPTKT